MMKQRNLSIIVLGLAMLCGCSVEDTFAPAEDGMIPLNIDGSINQVQTRATALGFVDKDALGLFAVNYGESNTVAGTLMVSGNQADNVKYVYDEPNHKWNPVKSVFYKDVNTHVDLYLYYPYQAGISNVAESNFEVQKYQNTEATSTSLGGYEASDFLWGKGVDITPTESRVAVSLSHKLSAVQVTLEEGSGFAANEFAVLEKSVILTGTTRKAKLDFTTGTATALGDPQLDGIVMCPQENGSFRAIVIPQTVGAGEKLFAITIDGISYAFRQNGSATVYQSGRQMNVSITINKKGLTGEYELVLGSTQITDWTEDHYAHGGDARQYFVVNVAEAGTLGKTIKDAGKNPDKIKNLKVVGNIKNTDFYFMRDSMAILEAVNLKETVVVPSEEVNEVYKYADDYENVILKYGAPDFEDEYGHSYWYDKGDNIPRNAFQGKSSLYFFTFPERVTRICSCAFDRTNISGALIIPDDVRIIEESAFSNCKLISSLSLPSSLVYIGYSSFLGCTSITGGLSFPNDVEYIGGYAFQDCRGFSGRLILPDKLKSLEPGVFAECSGFTGDLRIPDLIKKIDISYETSPFSSCGGLNGTLDLNNVVEINSINVTLFGGCNFHGELILPEGMISTNNGDCQGVFRDNHFSKIVFPSTLKKISNADFACNDGLTGDIVLPEGCLQIANCAFDSCINITGIELPSTLINIGPAAFRNCYNVCRIVSKARETPNTLSEAFDGMGKDNVVVEVPEASVTRYQASPEWCNFKRIGGHQDFSISRRLMRTLNAGTTGTYVLRAPSGSSWSIQSKPDWITVSPSSGTGKTNVSITIAEMSAGDVGSFEVNEGSFLHPDYHDYSGRGGEIVFLLDDCGYTSTMVVEQYDYEYPDGYVKTYNSATTGDGIDIVIIGDGYDAKDIANGVFMDNADEAVRHFFDLEPYKTYEDYFNVYAVTSLSAESGIGTENSVIDNKFGSYFTQDRLLAPAAEPCFAWAKKADNSIDFTKSLVILLMNTSNYEGICSMYGDGSALACCPVSRESYPYDFRGIIQHEAGGHGFGKLADEYVYHNAFIQTCKCQDGCDHGSSFNIMKERGWYKNLSFSGDTKLVPWSHLIYNPQFSNYVDVYEGGYMHSRGVYRSEPTSCMNNNVPYYSAISRQAIVERIMSCAGMPFSFNSFCENDSNAFGAITRSSRSDDFDWTFGVDPEYSRGSEHGSVVYMGEHPDYSKIK